MASRMKFHGDKVLSGISRKTPGIVHRIAETIAERARRIVVVRTGNLRDSIRATDKGVEVTADYAAAVELGTATRAARPYMRPSIEQFNQQDLKRSIS